jgi:hypothetical protein
MSWKDRGENAAKASRQNWEGVQEDIQLNLVLGDARDLSAYHDCIQWARWEGARAGEGKR